MGVESNTSCERERVHAVTHKGKETNRAQTRRKKPV